MVEFLLTSTVHTRADALCTFLLTPEQVISVLPGHLFRNVTRTGPDALALEFLFLGRWWKTQGRLERPSAVAMSSKEEGGDAGGKSGGSPGEQAVIWRSPKPVPLEVAWRMTPLKRDRRGERVTLRLRVQLKLPGGGLGRLVERLLVERPLLTCWDSVLRAVVTAHEGVPRSGIKGEG